MDWNSLWEGSWKALIFLFQTPVPTRRYAHGRVSLNNINMITMFIDRKPSLSKWNSCTWQEVEGDNHQKRHKLTDNECEILTLSWYPSHPPTQSQLFSISPELFWAQKEAMLFWQNTDEVVRVKVADTGPGRAINTTTNAGVYLCTDQTEIEIQKQTVVLMSVLLTQTNSNTTMCPGVDLWVAQTDMKVQDRGSSLWEFLIGCIHW